MGYDCTFHLIDEDAIRHSFVPKLLGRVDSETVLDQIIQDSESLWERVRGALNGQDLEEPGEVASPERAASLVCQLAVMFSACSLPHHYERGLAFSLWDRIDLDGAGEFPDSLAFDPEPLFNEVVEKYPALRGQFSRWFTGNGSTGVFVPAQHVAEVLAWLETTIQSFSRGDRRRFKGLVDILRTAATKNLGFWEATDLAVPVMGTVPGDPKLMTADYLRNRKGKGNPRVQRAPVDGDLNAFDWSIANNELISTDQQKWRTSFWDLAKWPPIQVHVVEEFAPYRTRLCDGSWLLFSSASPNEKPRIFRPRLLGSDRSWKTIAPVILDGKECSVSRGGSINRKLIVFRPIESSFGKSQSRTLAPPVMLEGTNWIPCPGLPSVEARQSELRGFVEDPVCGIVKLGDGGELLVWDGDGYEWRRGSFFRRGKFVLTYPMAARKGERPWGSLSFGNDRLFYIADRRLFEARRSMPPIPHVANWTNIMYLFPGPEGSIIIREGDNKDGDASKLYFPNDGSLIHVEPELFDDNEYGFVYWSQESDRFLVHYGKEWLSIKTSVVLAQPRFRADSGVPI